MLTLAMLTLSMLTFPQCIYVSEHGNVGGTLYGTNYRVIFVPDGYSPAEATTATVEPWMVPSMSITRLRRETSDSGTITLTIECITCRCVGRARTERRAPLTRRFL